LCGSPLLVVPASSQTIDILSIVFLHGFYAISAWSLGELQQVFKIRRASLLLLHYRKRKEEQTRQGKEQTKKQENNSSDKQSKKPHQL